MWDIQKDVVDRLIESYSKVDVVIAGASYSGLMAALKLSEEGYRVLVVEHNPGITPLAYYGGLWGHVVLSKDVEKISSLLKSVFETSYGYIINSLELYSKIIAKIYENNSTIMLGYRVEPVFEYIDSELEITGAHLKPSSEEEGAKSKLFIKAKYIIDSSGLEAYVSLNVIEVLRPGVVPQGVGPIIPFSKEIVERTGWLIEDSIIVTGLAASNIYGSALPFPDVAPLLESGVKAYRLIKESERAD